MTAVTSSQMLWYTTRATGVVALVLLTGSMVLGMLTTVRFRTRTWPRFAFQDLHRRVALLAVVFVATHVVTTVSDSYAPIGWVSAFVPFTSPYRRLWLGLGTVAVDLLLAVTVSSLLRRRINPRTWRALHWLAYGSWPLAVVHALGTGTDPHLEWMLLLVVGCVAAVLMAVGWRLVDGWPARAGARVAAGATSLVAIILLAAWTATGPLGGDWARRSGTPTSLLASSAKNGVTVVPSPSPPAIPTGLPDPPYRAAFSGTISRQTEPDGSVRLDIQARTSGAIAAVLHMLINGSPDASGGVFLHQSQVSFGPPGAPARYEGHIIALDGPQMTVALAESSVIRIDLQVVVTITGTEVTGELTSVRSAGDDGGAGVDH